MSFLRKWLRVEKPKSAALHVTRSLELAMPAEEAFDRCVAGIENVLGGIVRESDRGRGYIEATFGLMFSERLSCTLQPLDDGARTRVTIESRRGARPEAAAGSQYVEALASYLTPG